MKILFALFIAFLLVGCITESTQETFKVANWNLQIFGEKKAQNQTLMRFYAQTIDDYDIVFVQEIRDDSGTAFPKLCSMLPGYNCWNSSRAGRTASKEQYGIIYKKEFILENVTDFNPDEKNRWQRPPIMAKFSISNYSFSTYNIHIQPSDVYQELSNLEQIINNEGNVMILGDLNADCNYYNTKNRSFVNWTWIINDSEDTTVASSSCAYDRIILNDDMKNEYIHHGIFKEGIIPSISDHYLVWAEIKVGDTA